ncbi:hypothetical protein [Fulvimarina sp. MAC3]
MAHVADGFSSALDGACYFYDRRDSVLLGAIYGVLVVAVSP